MTDPPSGARAPAEELRPDFVFVTGNHNKAEEARRIVGRRLDVEAVELPEIQSLDPREVLRAKAREAWSRLGRALVVEETSLELDALGGFPGPLVKWMLQAAGAEGIARCAHGLGNPAAIARCLVLHFDGEHEVVGEGLESGTLVLPARGATGFGWDVVFAPAGSNRTYAELGAAEKDARGHRGMAWRDLMAKLAAFR